LVRGQLDGGHVCVLWCFGYTHGMRLLVATLAVVVALLKNWDFLEGYTLHR